MKKSAKPAILLTIMLLILFTLTLLFYVGIRIKCEVLTKEKVLAREELNLKRNWHVNLLAQYQMLTEEDRITTIALNQLGMKKRTEQAIEVNVNTEKIQRIQKIIDEKYE